MAQPHRLSIGAWLAPAIPALYLVLGSSMDLLPRYGVFNGKRLLEILVILAVLLVASLSRPLQSALTGLAGRIPRWVGICLGLALLLGLASALRHPQPGYGLADVTLLGLLVPVMLVVAASRAIVGARFDGPALLAIAALGMVVAVHEAMGLLAGWVLGKEFSYDQMLVRFAHPRFYNQLQSWTLPLLAALPFVFNGGRRLKVAAVLLLGLQWCLLLMTGARASFLSIVTALLLVTLFTGAVRSRWLKLHVAGLVAGLALFLAVTAAHGTLAPGGGAFVEQSVGRAMLHSTGRTHMWTLAWQDAVKNPLLGAGPMRFNCEGSVAYPAHPHSFPMRLLAEWGFPATLLIMAVCGYLAWALFRQLLSTREHGGDGTVLDNMLITGVLAAAMHACLSGLLTMPASQVMAFLLCGWLLGAARTGAVPGSAPRFVVWLGCLAAVAAAVWLAAFSYAEIRQMDLRTGNLAGAGPAHPRYWQHGRACLYSYELR